MDGSTSGTITLQPAAAAGTWTFTLPVNDGDNGQVLTTNGSGTTMWTTVAGGGGITNAAGLNVIPVSDGTNLVASQISDDGNEVTMNALAFGDFVISKADENNIGTGFILVDGPSGVRDRGIAIAEGGFKIYANTGVDGSGTFEPFLNLSGNGPAILEADSTSYSELRGGGAVVHSDGPSQTISLTAANGVFINGVKKYVALLTQSGTSAPVATVLENTLGDTPTYTRDFQGSYYISKSGGFDPAKTVFFFQSPGSYNGSIQYVIAEIAADAPYNNSVYFQTHQTFAVAVDNWGAPIPIEIIVYP